jgi:hypothetical protein
VYIPNASNRAKLRPLGIPVIADRCHQGRVRHAPEPEWEARFEPRSYGFRPGRSCQDAEQAIYATSKGPTAKRTRAALGVPGRESPGGLLSEAGRGVGGAPRSSCVSVLPCRASCE